MTGWGEGHIKGIHHWERSWRPREGCCFGPPCPQSLYAKDISGVLALASPCSIFQELGRCTREPIWVNLEHRQHGAMKSPRQGLFGRELSQAAGAEELKRQVETGRAFRALGLMSYVQIPYICIRECTPAQAVALAQIPDTPIIPTWHTPATCLILRPTSSSVGVVTGLITSSR